MHYKVEQKDFEQQILPSQLYVEKKKSNQTPRLE